MYSTKYARSVKPAVNFMNFAAYLNSSGIYMLCKTLHTFLCLIFKIIILKFGAESVIVLQCGSLLIFNADFKVDGDELEVNLMQS